MAHHLQALELHTSGTASTFTKAQATRYFFPVSQAAVSENYRQEVLRKRVSSEVR